MSFVNSIINNKLSEAKELILARLEEIIAKRLQEAKRYVAEDMSEKFLDEAAKKRNPNIIKMGRIQKIRRRIRRNAKGRIILQRNKQRSGIKGYRISGKTVKRIPANVRLHKARLLKRSWKTTRRAKLRRTLFKRRMSMMRRKSIGLR
jgi:hypothetical protein